MSIISRSTVVSSASPQTANPRQELLASQLAAAYHQILERQPLFHERQHEFQRLEKDYFRGKVNTKRLVREIGRSKLYQRLFFEGMSSMCCVEEGFKHFLGRPPASKQEFAFYNDILLRQGIVAMVDAFLNSEDYHLAFGKDTLPHRRESYNGMTPKTYLLSSKFFHHQGDHHQMQSLPLLREDPTSRRFPSTVQSKLPAQGKAEAFALPRKSARLSPQPVRARAR